MYISELEIIYGMDYYIVICTIVNFFTKDYFVNVLEYESLPRIITHAACILYFTYRKWSIA